MRTRSIGYMLLAAVVAVPIVSTVGVLTIEQHQAISNQKFVEHSGPRPIERNGVLVVYYSRSGNTELMALEIAKAKHAPTIRLKDADYRLGFLGWVRALRDARGRTAGIAPAQVDLTSFGTIYIGAPIWLYSPAPPIWQFVRNNDFSGKRVILFNSLNSKFEQRYIDEFAALVRRRGGVFVRHVSIVRGRMTRQVDTPTLLKRTRALLATPSGR